MKKTILIFLLLSMTFVSVSSAENWTGADQKAEEAIKRISPDYEPWFTPIWEPPSGEIESLLFSLQSAIGAFVVGYIVGRNRASRDAQDD